MKLLKAYDKHLIGEQDFSGNIRGKCPLRLIEDKLLKDKFKASPCYIVGKGPSLANISNVDFESWSCPIICVNDSLKIILSLGLPNPLFYVAADRPSNYYPPNDIIKVLPHLVAHFYKHLKNVYVIETNVIKHLSSSYAIHLAYYLGCETLEFIAFDAFFGLTGYHDGSLCDANKQLTNVSFIKDEIRTPYVVSLPKEKLG